MAEDKLFQIMELRRKPLVELRAKYVELFPGQQAPSNNKIFLWRKIAYRLQEMEHGGISTETQSKINELIQKYDPMNNKSLRPDCNPKEFCSKAKIGRDHRIPIPGTVITKEYKGVSLQVKVIERGFEYNNKAYKSLSAIAKEVTGAHWNGYLFFNL